MSSFILILKVIKDNAIITSQVFFFDRDLRGNLCRNPTGESSPWCFTMDPEKRSEQCNLKKCSSQPLPPQRGKSVNFLKKDLDFFHPLLCHWFYSLYMSDCKEGNGATYRGPTSTTAKGVTCQVWSSQYPHQHYRFTPETHPDKGLDGNVRPYVLAKIKPYKVKIFDDYMNSFYSLF